MFAVIQLFLPIVALVKSMPADNQNVCTTPDASGRISEYAPFPDSCDKYIQCVPGALGKNTVEERQCAFSTFWDNDLVSCVSVDTIVCVDDPCKGSQLKTFKAMGNCRGYWMCENEQSSAKCCDVNMTFDAKSNSCVTPVDFNCTDACFQEVIPVVPESICLKNAIEAKPDKYLQWVSDFSPAVEMDCAKGTYFNNNTCICEIKKKDPLLPTGPVCEPEVYLSFNSYPIKDESGKNNYVSNENVTVENGSALFDGVTSKLVIPRFNSLDKVKTVVISIKYSSDHMADATERAIVSNDDGHGFSIMIKEDTNNIIFECGTTGRPSFGAKQVPNDSQVTIQQNQNPSATPSTKHVTYQLANDKLICDNGADKQEAAAPGYLRSIKSGLQIGYADGVANFKGTVEEINVYLCSPEQT